MATTNKEIIIDNLLSMKTHQERDYQRYKDKNVSFSVNGKNYSGLFKDVGNVTSISGILCFVIIDKERVNDIPRNTTLTFSIDVEDEIEDDMGMLGGKRRRSKRSRSKRSRSKRSRSKRRKSKSISRRRKSKRRSKN